MSPEPRARFDFQSLERLARGQSTNELARTLGVHARQITRWREYGMLAEHADRAAVALHVMPSEVWGDAWTDAVKRACEAQGCDALYIPDKRVQRFCSDRCRQREWVRQRHANDPEFAAVQRARSNAYYAECSEYVRGRRRDHYAKHGDKRRSKKAA